MWDTIILRPMVNALVAMTNSLWGSFGLAIILLTVVIRLITLPLTMRQLRSTKAMQEVAPKLKELQKTYAKDKAKLQEETMKLYRQAGINPLGCLFPMLVQVPIWIALYQAIIRALGSSPEDLLGLSRLLYSWPIVNHAIPLNDRLFWLTLSTPDPVFVLPVLTGLSMWLQQKMSMPVTADMDPQSRQTNTMMLWMMPLMFAFLTLQFPSGLAVYWVAFNVLGIVIQYFVSGWGGLATVPATLSRVVLRRRAPAGPKMVVGTVKETSLQKKVVHGTKLPRDKRKNR